jgi:hypothetical protein
MAVRERLTAATTFCGFADTGFVLLPTGRLGLPFVFLDKTLCEDFLAPRRTTDLPRPDFKTALLPDF